MMEEVDGHHLMVLGLASARIKDPKTVLRKLRESFPGVELQLMRADRIAGPEHILFATRNAVRAFGQDYKRSRSLAMEILLYTSCQRQISNAIEMLGVTPMTNRVAVAAVSKRSGRLKGLSEVLEKMIGGTLDSRVLEIGTKTKLSELKRVFRILNKELEASRIRGEKEGEAVKRLVLERSALLALEG